MNHLNEEQLVLYYYGENAEGAEEHLGGCEQCRSAYHTLQRVLNSVDSLPVPERAENYEAQVWSAIEKQLPRKSRLATTFSAGWFDWRRLALAGSMAALLVVAFVAGGGGKKSKTQVVAIADTGVRERVLLVAVGNHLERSQTILVEIANASAKHGKLDISYEQRAAEDLLEENRLYRQTAATTGDVSTASLLEDLERVLLEIAHSPSAVSARQLEDLRLQIEDRGILFKVKVFGTQLEQRDAPRPSGPATL